MSIPRAIVTPREPKYKCLAKHNRAYTTYPQYPFLLFEGRVLGEEKSSFLSEKNLLIKKKVFPPP
jgi:hypothetical protein